jgi:serine/threonine protein kinase
LLAVAFLFFFRREVECRPELATGLTFDSLQHLTTNQAQGFADVSGALDSLGDRFDTALEQLGRIESVVGQTQTAVLDMHAELHRLEQSQRNSAAEVRQLLQETLTHLARLQVQAGEVRPQLSLSIRSDAERRAVRHLVERYEQLPDMERNQAPALLNGLGKLQVGAGDFAAARQTFSTVAAVVGAGPAQAEACFNSGRAALEQHHWDEALDALLRAAAADPVRFAPFPLQRYQPQRILGAGGFGTAFLCHDRFFKADVVVKTLHADDLERGLDDVFAEAQALRQVQHPAVIDVLECSYADLAAMSRPYIVMEYFPGLSLSAHVQQHGQLPPSDLLAVARLIAAGMREVHRRRILHRDLKPDNVLVRQTDGRWEAKIIDFGLALRRQTVTVSATDTPPDHSLRGEDVAGTVRYAPPEQLGETPGIYPGPYSDVYSFGKLCCFALFGTTEPRSRQLKSVPDLLRELLESCMEQVEHRLYDFDRVLRVLDVIDGKPSPSPEPSRVVRPAPVQRSPATPSVVSPREQEQVRAALAETETLMARLEEVQRQAEQACAECALKVQTETCVASPRPPEAEQVHALRVWLTKLATTVSEGKWKPAQVGLGKWTAQARQQLSAAESARDSSTAALRARRELRGLLEALQAKAQSRGRAEDEALAALDREASQLLRRRPTPLARAQELVAAYEARLL